MVLIFKVLIIFVVFLEIQQTDTSPSGTDSILATTPKEKGNVNVIYWLNNIRGFNIYNNGFGKLNQVVVVLVLYKHCFHIHYSSRGIEIHDEIYA